MRTGQRMLLVLESQRRLGTEAYPPSLRRIAERRQLEVETPWSLRPQTIASLKEGAIVAARAK